MREPSQSKEHLRRAIKTLSPRPPPDPKQSHRLTFDIGQTKQEVRTVIIALLLSLACISIIIILLAINLHWI